MTFTTGDLFPSHLNTVIAAQYCLIHALGNPSQAPAGIRTRVPRLRGGRLYKLSYPSPIYIFNVLNCNTI